MKKFLQFLGGAVVAASVIPYSYAKDEESGRQTVQALLWRATLRSQPEEGEKKLTVTLGFNNPLRSAQEQEPLPEDEAGLFADDELAEPCECREAAPCCCEDCQCGEAGEVPCGDAEPCCGQECCGEAHEETATGETDSQI